MSNFIEKIEDEISKLNHIEKLIRRNGEPIKKYSFVVKRIKNKEYFYINVKRRKKWKLRYVGTRNSERVQHYFRLSYNATLLPIIAEDIKLLTELLIKYKSYDTSAVMARLSPCLSEMKPFTFFDEVTEDIIEWANKDHPINTYPFDKRATYAKDGRRVRSKNECIIYNELLDMGLPNRYDSVISLRRADGTITSKSPDFLFKCLDGTEIILECAGLLTKEGYLQDFKERVQLYLLNGFVLGVNFYVISEDKDGGLDTKALSEILDLIYKRVYSFT